MDLSRLPCSLLSKLLFFLYFCAIKAREFPVQHYSLETLSHWVLSGQSLWDSDLVLSPSNLFIFCAAKAAHSDRCWHTRSVSLASSSSLPCCSYWENCLNHFPTGGGIPEMPVDCIWVDVYISILNYPSLSFCDTVDSALIATDLLATRLFTIELLLQFWSVCFWDKLLLCCPGGPETCIAQAGLECMFLPPQPPDYRLLFNDFSKFLSYTRNVF